MEAVIKEMINISGQEIDDLTEYCSVKKISKNEIVSPVDYIPNDIFFINTGLLRVILTDKEGNNHTIHFAMENQFIADYSCFIQQIPSIYTIQAIEPTEVVVLPRKAVEWGYKNLTEGEKLGRIIAEFYLIYKDNRIMNLYSRTPKERYDAIGEVFPNIHNRAPQHMIASYLGITPEHLSRLKKEKV
ncbi:Crp/Fnr family transcriptional regulator [Flavobacterium salilacus subsp. salilacus]|nr:Crp/Fnr family transcriptional regulator [Flavobacterium salilacus subsp. salilacus]MBE1615128.1 Crp/Fnr family transcriptional regulator [Flavobacterium sp. SaA2.13]